MHPNPIPIHVVSPGASIRCDAGADAGARPALPLGRREWLRGSALLMGVLAAGSPLALLAPSTAWALEVKALDQPTADALLAMGRTLYPHDKLPDAVYALLVKDLDGKAAADAKTAALLQDGVKALDRAAGGSFVRANAATRLAAVRSLQDTPFFSAVRGPCITALYDNEMAYTVFGYPGASWPHGGYLTRGFQDLTWLPAPPESASPDAELS